MFFNAVTRMTSIVRIVCGLVVGALGCALATEVSAEPAFCADLRDQYRIAVKPGGNDALRRQLSQAQLAARQGNCRGGLFAFLSQPSPACPQINATIGRLQRQLSMAGGGSGWMQSEAASLGRARLRSALLENGCALPTPAVAGRTLCVRTCDGYYFPISNKVSGKQVKIDAAACQSMYAEEGQAELFIQPPGASDVAEARSPQGKRYADQPFAFQFRATYDAACHAQLKVGVTALAARYLEAKLAKDKTAPPATTDQGASSLDTPLSSTSIAATLVTTDESRPAVRLVGDAYYSQLYDLSRPLPASYERQRQVKRLHNSQSVVTNTPMP